MYGTKRQGTKRFTKLSAPVSNDPNIKYCLVCGRKADGVHYGRQCCICCKTFFRRSVLREQEPTCYVFKDNADETKNECGGKVLCRGCRYKRCLDIGMDASVMGKGKELIEFEKGHIAALHAEIWNYHRIVALFDDTLRPKRDIIDRRRTSAPTSPLQQPPSTSVLNFVAADNGAKSDALVKLISHLTTLDDRIRLRKEEMFRMKNAGKQLSKEFKGTAKPKSLGGHMRITQRSDMAAATQVDMLMLLEWAKTVPEFATLPLEERIILLKRFAVYYLIIEHGYATSKINIDDVWVISDGTCMPKNINLFVNSLSPENKMSINEGRIWRQEKLYKQMTDRCIDEVARPFRRLQLLPEEVLTLKVIVLFNCDYRSQDESNTLLICDDSQRKLVSVKTKIINALFEFYKSKKLIDYEGSERFGNVVLTLSGIFSAATALLESYQIMRLFRLTVFDPISEQLLFNASE